VGDARDRQMVPAARGGRGYPNRPAATEGRDYGGAVRFAHAVVPRYGLHRRDPGGGEVRRDLRRDHEPSLLAKEGGVSYRERIREIATVIDGPIRRSA
jgi:hypothetical protein